MDWKTAHRLGVNAATLAAGTAVLERAGVADAERLAGEVFAAMTETRLSRPNETVVAEWAGGFYTEDDNEVGRSYEGPIPEGMPKAV